jgi:hypothetical protein
MDMSRRTASNLTTQVRGLAKSVIAAAEGDLSQKFVVAVLAEFKGTLDAVQDVVLIFDPSSLQARLRPRTLHRRADRRRPRRRDHGRQ